MVALVILSVGFGNYMEYMNFRSIKTLFGLLLLAMLLPVNAAEITADQLRMFQQLPAAERTRLIDELTGSQSDGRSVSEKPEFPELIVTEPKEAEEDFDKADDEERIQSGETLVITIDPAPSFISSKIFQLDSRGVLHLPLIAPIELAGLTVEEAAARIAAEPMLKVREDPKSLRDARKFRQSEIELVSVDELKVDVQRLPVIKTELKPYGYELFNGVPTTFAPATDVPVPSDYVIGPGDTIELQLYGKEASHHTLAVQRDGSIFVPDLGPMNVAGLSFSTFEKKINRFVEQKYIGMRAKATMGELRSIRVFVLGEVNNPGSYTVSALTTLTNALLVSGGVKEIGSLRRIAHKRNGKVVGYFDLYQLLMQGDTRGDSRLQQGDVIFVPTVDATIAIDGEVRRPAIYELKSETTVEELVGLAGGLTTTADRQHAQLERTAINGRKRLIDLNLTAAAGLQYKIASGDRLKVEPILSRVEQTVYLSGHVQRPGAYQWHQGMRLLDVLQDSSLLLPYSDLDYLLIVREQGVNRTVVLHSASLRRAMARPESDANPLLQSQDRIMLFSMLGDGIRQESVRPLIEKLKQQAVAGEPAAWVEVAGSVREPGTYPLERSMRVSDLIRAGGKLSEEAYMVSAELTRLVAEGDGTQRLQHINIDLQAALNGDQGADRLLDPHDRLQVKVIPDWTAASAVEVFGEVGFPGEYRIVAGERLSELLLRVGGIKPSGDARAAVLLREELRVREQKAIDRLAAELESEITTSSLSDERQGSGEVGVAKELSSQLRSTRAVGRLVIDLPRLLADIEDGNESELDVVLKDSDRLYIPTISQEVMVMGEVLHPNTMLHRRGMSVRDYIGASGGMSKKADSGRVYVVRADGSVVTAGQSWLDMGSSHQIQPGDTVVVPLDVERIRTMTLLTNISQILYQVGIAAASWKTVGVF